MTFGNEIKERNLDWTQLRIKNVTYEDEMKYIVEFDFSSGVSIRERVKLDVVGEYLPVSE